MPNGPSGMHRLGNSGRVGAAMRWFGMFSRRRRYEELAESMREHIGEKVDELVSEGMPREEAEFAARREFGNVTRIEERSREVWQWPRVESLWADAKYALRQMKRSPGFAATVIGTLAVGIGAAAAMFTVVDHVLLKPVPYYDAARLLSMRESDGSASASFVPWLDVGQWLKESRSFQEIAFSTTLGRQDFLEGATAATHVNGEQVTANLFETLGAQPELGRGFLPETPSFAPGKNTGTIVLSDAVWRSEFGGDRSILGKVVRINETPYTVIGVMPPGFRYPADAFSNRSAQVWVALQLGPSDAQRTDRPPQYQVIGRLRRGATLHSAQAEMATIQKLVAAQYSDPDDRRDHSEVVLERYGNSLVDADVRKALLAASGVLWLIAGLNVTNLLLARGTARQREMAMRGALGASRRRVMQQMMVEGLVLSGPAALLGTGLALGSVKLLAHELSQRLPLPVPATPDGRILLALLGMTVISALMSTAWPALLALRAPIEPALRQGGLQAGTGRGQHRMRAMLVAVEVAMSLTLLVACGLLLRTIYTLRHVALGYRTDHIIVADLSIPSFRYAGKNMLQMLYMPMLGRVQQQHGVQAAGLMNEVPLGNTFNILLGLRMDEGSSSSGAKPGASITAMLKPVTPDIQRVFGFRMLAGRYFDAEDTPTSEPVVVVNPAFAREYAPNRSNPASILGMTMWHLQENKPLHIVGILERERQKSVAEESQPEVQVCLCQITPASSFYPIAEGIAMDLAVRTERPTEEMVPELRDILRQASPELAGANITTMDQIVEDSYGSQQLAAHLLEIFGGSALLLCVAGLYGLLAYVVTQRTREMGVRIALGAPRGNLLWLILRQAGAMLLTGVAAGVGLAWASARLVRGFLYGVQAHDGWTLACAAALLFLSGMLAAYLPARRAASVDPMEALRAE